MFATKETQPSTTVSMPPSTSVEHNATGRYQPMNDMRSLHRNVGNGYVGYMVGGQTARAQSVEGSAPASQKKIDSQGALAPDSTSENTRSIKAISGSGAGTASVKYTPEASDTSTKIVFIQVMRELLDGKPALPSATDASFAYQDADTTGDFYHVDYVSGEADPYYNGDDAGDFGTQGNAISTPKVDAAMTDTPSYPDGSFPVGNSKLTWEFRTIAFSAAGADKGKYYAYAKWTYEKEKGKAATMTHGGTSTDTSLPKSRSAIDLWATNHGFAMPK